MANSIEQELKRMQQAFLKLQKSLPRAMGNEVRNRSLENFRLQAFNNKDYYDNFIIPFYQIKYLIIIDLHYFYKKKQPKK